MSNGRKLKLTLLVIDHADMMSKYYVSITITVASYLLFVYKDTGV